MEWEADISRADIMRFAAYHIDLSRMHNIHFTSVIITTKEPSIAEYESPSMTFTPKIINLKNQDADRVLEEINRKVTAGEHSSINELEIIYLPLYGSVSGKTTPELLDTAIKLTSKIAPDDKLKQRKLNDLIILLTSTFVNDEDLRRILEANMKILEENRAVRVLEAIFRDKWMEKGIEQGMERGMEQGIEQVAINMIRDGDDYAKISRLTGLSTDRVMELAGGLPA